MKTNLRIVVTSVFLVATLDLGFKAYANDPVDSTKVVRVLTYNIYHGETMKGDFDLDMIAEVISSAKPDLVALQEVDFFTNRARNMDLATELGKRTNMAPLFGKAMEFDEGEYGEGILSRYSFSQTKNHALFAQQGKEPRAALEVMIILQSGDTIRFVGTHLDHTRDETDRINQAKQLNEIFGARNIPTILAGDLNAKPGSATMKILSGRWTQTFEENSPTFPSKDPRIKIDYILFKPANRWRVLETRVLNAPMASDHCPVLSVLELK